MSTGPWIKSPVIHKCRESVWPDNIKSYSDSHFLLGGKELWFIKRTVSPGMMFWVLFPVPCPTLRRNTMGEQFLVRFTVQCCAVERHAWWHAGTVNGGCTDRVKETTTYGLRAGNKNTEEYNHDLFRCKLSSSVLQLVGKCFSCLLVGIQHLGLVLTLPGRWAGWRGE